MYWQIDTRLTRGGWWECREKRRARNALRVRMFGSQVYVPDGEFKEFAVRLREQRKEALSGR